MDRLEDVVGDRRTEQPADHPGDAPLRADQRDREAATAADRLEHGDRTVVDDVHRLVQAALGGGDEGAGALDVLGDGERRVGEHAERHRRHAQQPAERARHVRADARLPRRTAPTGTPIAPADRVGGRLDRGEVAAELRRRGDRRRLVGSGQRCRGPAVDLDAAAHDDRLERPALGDRAEDRLVAACSVRVVACRGARPTERLPHRQVHDHVRVERGDQLEDAVVVARAHEVELGAVQPSARRVGVDAEHARRPTARARAGRRVRDPRSPPIPDTSTRRPATSVHA